MIRFGKEDLGQYVSRVIKEKGFSVREVQVMSGGKITAGYVSSIMNGAAKNPSIDKLKALAIGLGVDEDEIFRVARGLAERPASKSQYGEQAHSMVILDMKKRIVISPDVSEILQEVLQLSPTDRVSVLETIRSLNKRESAAHPGEQG